jgi:small subunit ribosomal protein S1
MINTITEPTSNDFAILLEKDLENMPKEKSIVKGKIVKTLGEFVFIEVKLKSEGRISKSEFKNYKGSFDNGTDIDVYIDKLEDKTGCAKLSYERVALELAWRKCEEACKNNSSVDGKIVGKVNKGGFAANIDGILAFLPGSQLDIRQVKDPSALYDIDQQFRVLKLDRSQGNIVVSRRAILEESRKEARNSLLSDVHEGMKFKGIVKNITHYGAFIDLGDIDGLLHITDISWERITHPTEKLSIGEEIEVVVTRFNAETQRVSLGMKQLSANPWENMEETFEVGKKYPGVIKEFSDHGIIVELKKDVRGLVYLNEICWNSKNIIPNKLFKIEEDCEVMVLDIDIMKHRLSLSIKKCLKNPWNSFLSEYPIGTKVRVKVNTILEFGLLVNVIEGDALNELSVLIPAIEINWEENPKEALKSFTVGDEVDGLILDADLERERIKISLKRLEGSELKKTAAKLIQSGPLTCTVTDVKPTGLFVELADNMKGFIKKYDLSMHHDQQNPERFTAGDRIDAKAIFFNKTDRVMNLSVKLLEISDERKAIKEFGSASSGASLGDILGPVITKNRKE